MENQIPTLSNYIERTSSEKRSYFDKTVNLDLLKKKERLFIIGEPGYGKSRLMKQLYDNFKEQKSDCCFVDLKDINDQWDTLENFIKKKIENHTSRKDLRLSINDFNFTKGFKLKNSKSIALFFDGLDEVNPDSAPTLLDDIDRIAYLYPKVKIYLTCRTHHVSRYKNQLYNFNFDCLQLQPFNIYQTVKFLKKNCKSLEKVTAEELSGKLTKANLHGYSFSTYNAKQTLNTPRYLEVLSYLINDKGFNEVVNLNRSELFDLFITERLKKESKSQEKKKQSFSGKIIYLKQCLERLALVMEIQRDNIIAKDDFITFLMDTDLNLDSQILLEVFFDGTILKDEGDFLEFDNTEFQEYLAAKAISRLGKSEQVIIDLTVEPQLNNIYDSWISVLSYLCELKSDIVLPIINMAYRFDNHHLFELIKYPKSEYFENNVDERQTIFTKILEYYSQRKKFLPYNFEMYLKDFYVHNSHHKILIKNLNEGDDFTQHINRTNSVAIISKVIDQDYFPPQAKTAWKKRLFDYLKKDQKYDDSLLIVSLKVLSLVSTITELKKINFLTEHKNISVRKALVHAFIEVDPNHIDSIELLVREISLDRFSFIYSLDQVNSNAGFLYLFDQIISVENPESFTNNILAILNESIISIFKTENLFFKNLSKCWSKDLEVKVVKVLTLSSRNHHHHHSEFFESLCEIYKSKNERAAIDCFNLFDNEDLEDDFLSTTDILGKLVKPDQVSKLIKLAKKKSLPEKFMLLVIRDSVDQKVKILEQKFYPTVYAQKLKNIKSLKINGIIKKMKVESKAIDQHATFIALLNKEDARVVSYFLKCKGSFENIVTPFQKKKFEKLIKNFLRKYDPKDGKIVYKRNNTFTVTLFGFYENLVELATVFQLNLEPHREKILKLAASANNLELVNKAVPSPTKSELKSFLDWYMSKKNEGLITHRLFNVIELIRENDYQESVNFLVKLIKSKKISCRNRCKLIELVFSWNNIPEAFFLELFKKSIKASKKGSTEVETDSYKIALTINNLLIREQNESAINWRIKEVLKSSYKIDRHFSGVRGVSSQENLGSIISYINNPKFYQVLMDFMKKSFRFLEKSSDYFKFVDNEIWQPVLGFFRNQKSKKRDLKKYINELKMLAQEHMHIPLADRIQERIDNLNKEYNIFLSEPDSFASCIQKYQLLKAKQYLDLTYPEELFTLIKDVINFEFREWVHQGYYRFIDDLSKYGGGSVGKEKIIQKTIASQLENFLLRRGLRNSDIKEVYPNFIREAELLSNKKVDLLISYGGIGSVMVEIKRASSSELGSAEKLHTYREETFLPYLNQTNCDFGIFLIFKDNPNRPKDLRRKISTISKAYSDLYYVEVIGIDCTKKKIK